MQYLQQCTEYIFHPLLNFWLTDNFNIIFNCSLLSVPYMARPTKILILIQEGIIKKISYERPDYESVDEKSLS